MRRRGFIRNLGLGALLIIGLPVRSADRSVGDTLQIGPGAGQRLRVAKPRKSSGSEGDEAQIPSYRLAPNDTVDITVFGEDDMSTQARIGKDGAVAVPLVGLVKIGGQTIREAAQTLEGRLRKYLVSPQVAVTILSYSKRRITILGQVNRPGTYDLPDEASIDLLEAIGMAGGYTRLANPSRITLKRMVQGRETLYKVDAKKMIDQDAGERVVVMPGDTIIVAERIL